MAKIPIEDQKELAKLVNKDEIIKNKVVIILGYASAVFKSIFQGNYHTITTSDEVKKFLSTYYLPNDQPLIFEDISLMTKAVQSYLLKFIEDPPCPLVILASKDNVSPIILSRCKKIIKIPYVPSTQESSLNTFIQDNEEALINNTLKDKDIYSKCPQFLYNYKQIEENTIMSTKRVLKYLKLL